MIKTFDQSGITLDTDAEEPNIPTKKGAKGVTRSNNPWQNVPPKNVYNT